MLLGYAQFLLGAGIWVYFLVLHLQRVMCDLPECACLLSDPGLTWVDTRVYRIWVWTLRENIK